MSKISEDIESQVEYYASMPHTIVIEEWDDGDGPYYLAKVVEFNGCMIDGETGAEALADLKDVKRDWIRTNLKLGNKIPSPIRQKRYSGTVSLRMPPSLHETLVELAEIEGISFNHYMVATLARGVGHDEVRKEKVH